VRKEPEEKREERRGKKTGFQTKSLRYGALEGAG